MHREYYSAASRNILVFSALSPLLALEVPHLRIHLQPWENLGYLVTLHTVLFVCMCEMNAGHDLLTPQSVAYNMETQDSLKGRVITAHSYSSSAASENRELAD